MVFEMFGNKRVNDLPILFDSSKFIGESKFNFNVATITATFIFISSAEKFFRVVLRPIGEMMSLKDTTAAMSKSIFAVNIFDVRLCGKMS